MPTRPIPDGYYAAKEAYNYLDWRLGGSPDEIPNAPINFWNYQIQYNQLEVHSMSCTIFAAAGAVSDLTGYRFTNQQFRDLVAEAKKDDFSDTDGWYIYKAVDLLRNWWKRNKEEIVTYRVDVGEADFANALKKGYSVVTGYRGNSQYNDDVSADGMLDNLSLGSTTYGHAIRIVQDRGKPEFARVVVDNYIGVQPFNSYRIKVADLSKLVKDNIFYASGYIFVSNANRLFKDVVRNSKTEWYYSCVEWAVKEKLMSGFEDGAFRPDEPVTRAQMAVLMKRLFDKLSKP